VVQEAIDHAKLIPGPYPSVALDKIRKTHGRFFWKKQHNGRNRPIIKTDFDNFHAGALTTFTSDKKVSPKVKFNKESKKNFVD
jgi:hypothetical protein